MYFFAGFLKTSLLLLRVLVLFSPGFTDISIVLKNM
jgi:hypothetical protein